MFFLCLNSRSRDLEFPKLAHMTRSLILMLSPSFKFLGLPFASNKQINHHLPKFANKNNYTCSHEISITEQMLGHYTFLRELTGNNFYQRNCVNFKPVPIIRFILQFGLRILWDSDPSGFSILKCPSLNWLILNFIPCFIF